MQLLHQANESEDAVRINFQQFTVDNNLMPDGEHVSILVEEATEGMGPDGEHGIVATGHEFLMIVNKDVALKLAFDLAITAGFMKDHDKPEIADLTRMREVVKKREEEQKRGKR